MQEYKTVRTSYPCHGCTERHLGCHSDCRKYLERQKDEQSRKDKMVNDCLKNIAVDEFLWRRGKKVAR